MGRRVWKTFALGAYSVPPKDPDGAITNPLNNFVAILVGATVRPGERGHWDGLLVGYTVGTASYTVRVSASATLCGYAGSSGEADGTGQPSCGPTSGSAAS